MGNTRCIGLWLIVAGQLAFNGGRAAGQTPTPDHIVIVIEENHAYNQIIGPEPTSLVLTLVAIPIVARYRRRAKIAESLRGICGA